MGIKKQPAGCSDRINLFDAWLKAAGEAGVDETIIWHTRSKENKGRTKQRQEVREIGREGGRRESLIWLEKISSANPPITPSHNLSSFFIEELRDWSNSFVLVSIRSG